MLYLNSSLDLIKILVSSYLTLTNVVFEFGDFAVPRNFIYYLTLTNVVFEFTL